jgi:hypothetical protein
MRAPAKRAGSKPDDAKQPSDAQRARRALVARRYRHRKAKRLRLLRAAGALGGLARWEGVSPRQRSKLAREWALARWKAATPAERRRQLRAMLAGLQGKPSERRLAAQRANASAISPAAASARAKAAWETKRRRASLAGGPANGPAGGPAAATPEGASALVR